MYDYDTCSESVLVKRAREKDVKAFVNRDSGIITTK